MNRKELSSTLAKHKRWRDGLPNGARADLSGADLRGAKLGWIDLSKADLSGADLSKADLSDADLSGADLRKACLSEAKLGWADLRGADLSGADLDYSCWPLWCGSLGVKIDKRIACQLLYHTLRAMQSVDDPEVRAVCNDPRNIALANQFHRAEECGRLEPKAEYTEEAK